MAVSIDMLHDVIKILEAVLGLEGPIKSVAAKAKQFARDFKEGNIKQAEADIDELLDTLDQVAKQFDAASLEAFRDLYEKIKPIGEKKDA